MMDIDMMLDESEREVGYDGSEVVTFKVKDEEEMCTLPNFDAYPDNTVEQIAESFFNETSVDLTHKSFCNTKIGKYFDDFSLTVGDLGLVNGDTLMFSKKRKTNIPEEISITVMDYDSIEDTKYITVSINSTLKEIAKEVGHTPTDETVFCYGGNIYTNHGLTLKKLGIEDGETIEINEKGLVAAS